MVRTRFRHDIWSIVSCDPGWNIDAKKLFSKNVFRIVLAFLIWSVLYAVFDCVLQGPVSRTAFLRKLINGHFHMWFLVMLAGLYILVIPLRRITASKNATRYFVILCLVFSFAIPTISLFTTNLPLFTSSQAFTNLASIISDTYSKMSYSFTLYYVAYFVPGWYLHSQPVPREWRAPIYIAAILSILGTTLLTDYVSLSQGKAFQAFYGNMNFTTMLESVAVFTFFQSLEESEMPSTSKIASSIAPNVFGVYLVHAMVLEFLNRFLSFNALSFNTAVSIPIVTLVVFIISLVFAALLRRIPVIGKYLC